MPVRDAIRQNITEHDRTDRITASLCGINNHLEKCVLCV